MDDGFSYEVELYKGDDPIDLPDTASTDSELTGPLYNAKAKLDAGEADRVLVYVAMDGELLRILDKTAGQFDVKETYTDIQDIKEEYVGSHE